MNKYVDVVRGWIKDPKSVSASQLEANYRAAREAYPIHKPRTPSEWAMLDACFESVFWKDAEACITKYDLENNNAK
jgi:hypothetical protein